MSLGQDRDGDGSLAFVVEKLKDRVEELERDQVLLARVIDHLLDALADDGDVLSAADERALRDTLRERFE